MFHLKGYTTVEHKILHNINIEMTFRWQADDRPLIVVLGCSSEIIIIKIIIIKKGWTPSDKDISGSAHGSLGVCKCSVKDSNLTGWKLL